MNIIEKNIEQINQLCEDHKVKTLYVFGSVLTNRFNNNSDIDMLVDFKRMDVNEYADNYFDFKFSLQDILKRRIDLLEEKAIQNPYFKQAVAASQKLIYGY